jgi:hypothetical protein
VTTSVKDAEAMAIRICRELYRLDGGQALRWHEAGAIKQKLEIDEGRGQAALLYAFSDRWVDIVGDPVSSITLLEGGRRIAEENPPPAEKPKRRAVKDMRRPREPT